MKILLVAAILSCATAVRAQVKLGGENVNALRLWNSGVSAVVSGNKEMAAALWRRCFEADPRNQNCRAGLILLGHQELIAEPDMSGYTPPEEEGLREGAKANISGRVDKKSASKNWNLGVIYFQKGDKRGARDAWTRCLELDPSNTDCRTGLERVGGPAGPPRGDSAKAGREYAAGMRFLMAGEKVKAAAAFKRCLAADAAHKDCAQGLERVR